MGQASRLAQSVSKSLPVLSILAFVWLSASQTFAEWHMVLGADDWLYWDRSGVMENYRAERPFTQKELAHWADALEDRRVWLDDQGIRYLYVIFPEKASVYPEYLPGSIEPAGAERRADQLVDYLSTHSSVEILYVRDALLAAKPSGRLYHKTDIHWNDKGAYYAYREIVDTLSQWFPAMQPASLDDFQDVRLNNHGLVIAAQAGLEDAFNEEIILLAPRAPRQASQVFTGILDAPAAEPTLAGPFATERADNSLPRAVMTHNSFAMTVRPFLSENFERIVYYFQFDFDPTVVKHEKPDVVIEQINDDQPYLYTPRNHPEIRGARLR